MFFLLSLRRYRLLAFHFSEVLYTPWRTEIHVIRWVFPLSGAPFNRVNLETGADYTFQINKLTEVFQFGARK